MAEALLDSQAVATALGCSVKHLSNLVRAGRCPRPVRVGRLVRWPQQVIDRWIAEGCPAVTDVASQEEESH